MKTALLFLTIVAWTIGGYATLVALVRFWLRAMMTKLDEILILSGRAEAPRPWRRYALLALICGAWLYAYYFGP